MSRLLSLLLLCARTARTCTELSTLTTITVDRHNRHIIVVVDSELVTAAWESVMDRTNLVLSTIINMQLRKEEAAYYLSTAFKRYTWTLKRTLQRHYNLAVRTKDRHSESSSASKALTRKTVRLFTRMEIRLLVGSTHTVCCSQIHIILILSFKASDQFKCFHTLLDE